jgi:hypothetical protein
MRLFPFSCEARSWKLEIHVLALASALSNPRYDLHSNATHPPSLLSLSSIRDPLLSDPIDPSQLTLHLLDRSLDPPLLLPIALLTPIRRNIGLFESNLVLAEYEVVEAVAAAARARGGRRWGRAVGRGRGRAGGGGLGEDGGDGVLLGGVGFRVLILSEGGRAKRDQVRRLKMLMVVRKRKRENRTWVSIVCV